MGSLAASYLMASLDTKLIGEIFGAAPVHSIDFNTDRYSSSLEALAGLKWDATSELAVHAGVGVGLIKGNADPAVRVYVGLNFSFGPLFSKKPIAQVEEIPKTATTEKHVVLRQVVDPFAGMPQAAVETFVVKDILFSFNSDELEADSKETLDHLAGYLNRPPVFNRLVISGHTDSVGRAAYNLALSQRRANAVKAYLVNSDAIPDTKVEAIGFGLTQPIASNSNYQGRALNRRVEFKIYRDDPKNPSHSVPNHEGTSKTIGTEPAPQPRPTPRPTPQIKIKAKPQVYKRPKKVVPQTDE